MTKQNMNKWTIVSTLIALFAGACCQEVCYDEVGCFDNKFPFKSSWEETNYLPQNRQIVNTTFTLYVRSKTLQKISKHRHGISHHPNVLIHNHVTMLYNEEPQDVWRSQFNSAKGTKIVIHGFKDTAESEWIEEIVNKFLIIGDFNLIVIGWNSLESNYLQSVANARLVAAEVFNKMKSIKAWQNGFSANDIHIIGHGIGAHIASYIGEHLKTSSSTCQRESGGVSSVRDSGWWQLPGWLDTVSMANGEQRSRTTCARYATVWRITGLDPAGQWFRHVESPARLDVTDATFVDVIHTDMLDHVLQVGVGCEKQAGHIDFYPNGGKNQPGCQATTVSSVDDVSDSNWQAVMCNHYRATALFIESLEREKHSILTLPCESYEKFLAGKCTHCRLPRKAGGLFSSMWQSIWAASWPMTDSRQSETKRRRRSEKICPAIGQQSSKYWSENLRPKKLNSVPATLKAFSQTSHEAPFSVRYLVVFLDTPEERPLRGSFSISVEDVEGVSTTEINVGRINHEFEEPPSCLIPVPWQFGDLVSITITWTEPNVSSWWDGVGGWWDDSTETREVDRFELSSLDVMKPPLTSKNVFCPERSRMLRSGRAARYTTCTT